MWCLKPQLRSATHPAGLHICREASDGRTELVVAHDVPWPHRTHWATRHWACPLALNTLGEKVHLLDTAGGLTASPGLVPAEARTALEAARLEKRLGELELELLGAQTDVAEHKAQRFGAERDFCTGIAGLRDDLTRLEV